MLDRDRLYRTLTGYSWGELYVLFGGLHESMIPNTGYAYVYRAAAHWMEDVMAAEETYTVPHALALIAARARQGSIEPGMTPDGLSVRDCYRSVYIHIANAKPHYQTVHNLMHFLFQETERNLLIPTAARSILEEIVKDYDTGQRYSDLDDLRNSMLKYIDTVRHAPIDITKKTQVIQACCYTLSLFH